MCDNINSESVIWCKLTHIDMLEWCIYTFGNHSTWYILQWLAGWLAGQLFSANVRFITFDTNLSHFWCLWNQHIICNKKLAGQSAIAKCKDWLVYKCVMHHSNIFMNKLTATNYITWIDICCIFASFWCLKFETNVTLLASHCYIQG